MTAPADADAEMREIIAAHVGPTSHSMDHARAKARNILDELRRHGAFFPDDPITDAMVEAGAKALRDHDGTWFSAEQARVAITAALAARKP